ncbi:TIR domain-containing protein [Desulfovibrio sp. OttesenSCG-928-I05]|nr:TIR domain-containing protein [Desulfovibrio sp. OttesenSCG-928-I05]
MRYDAFISYRHGGLDGQVAERLHAMLETFRVPGDIAAKCGKKRIARVFRDREELPTSSDLSGSIDDALRESEFLILICSRRTCQSRWVLQEVDRFIELGRHDRIIPLLIDGEPDEAFPEQLRWREVDGKRVEVEPLAADIRAGTPRQSLKLLKDELLRILAPMLGCRYDDLRQRHRERAMRRTLAAALAALAVAVTFGSVSFSQLMRINEQMRMKLYNQSYVLAEYSADALRDGDTITAALLALEGLPNDPANPERPYVDAAEAALVNAMGVYDYRESFVPHLSVEFPATPSAIVLSPDDAHLAVLRQDNVLDLLDTGDGSIVFSAGTPPGPGRNAVFPAADIMVFTGDDGLSAVRVPTGELLWRTDVAFGVALSADGTTIAAACDGYALLLDPQGTEKARFDFGSRSLYRPSYEFPSPYNCLALSADGALLAVNFTDGTFSVFSAADGSERRLLDEAAWVRCAFSGTHLLCSWIGMTPDAVYSSQTRGAFTSVFDLATFERVWEESGGVLAHPLLFDKELAVAHGTNFHLYDPDARRTEVMTSFERKISGIATNGSFLLAGLDDGTLVFQALNLQGEQQEFYREDGESLVFYQSEYPYSLLALGGGIAVVATPTSPAVRILQWNGKKADVLYRYSTIKSESARSGDNVYLHAINAIRVVDAANGEERFLFRADPEELPNIHFTVHYASGNVVQSTPSGCLLYSIADGSILFEDPAPHCVLTESGLNVLREKDVLLVDPATGKEVSRHALPEGSEYAWVRGPWMFNAEGWNFTLTHQESGVERQFTDCLLLADQLRETPGTGPDAGKGAGKSAGKGATEADLWLSYFSEGRVYVYSTRDDAVLFQFESPNEVPRVFFENNGAFLKVHFQSRRDIVYSLPDGTPLPVMQYKDHILTDVYAMPDPALLLTVHVSAQEGRVTGILRDSRTLEAKAEIPGCTMPLGEKHLLAQSMWNVKAIPWRSSAEILAMARKFTAGRELAPEQRRQYHIVE